MQQQITVQIKCFFTATFMTLVCMTSAVAFSVDGLVKFAKKGSVIYTLRNDTDEDLYVTSKIFALEVQVDGDVREIEYTADNVESWDVSLSTSKFIMRKGEVKRVILSSLSTNESLLETKAYMVRFSPNKVDMGKNELSVSYGYGVLSLFEAGQESKGKPVIERIEETLTVSNMTNKFAVLKFCSAEERQAKCPVRAYLIPGRVKTFKLDEVLGDGKVRVVMTSNDARLKYEEIF